MAIAVSLVLAVAHAVDGDDRPHPNVSQDDAIKGLVEQLGSDQYVVRRRAEEALLRLGAKAFDVLKAAEHDSDPEIVARATYLTRLIDVPWTTDDDPAEVRTILSSYAGLGYQERLKRILALVSLTGRAGTGALCRIARFEQSPVLAKMAALSVLESQPSTRKLTEIVPSPTPDLGVTVRRELGASQRPAARWLRTLVLAGDDPRAALPRWRALVEEERRQLASHPARSRSEFVLALMREQVTLLQRLGHRDQAVAVMLQMVEIDGRSDPLAELVEWLAGEQAWDVVDQIAERFAQRFKDDPLLLYTLAQARRAQGNQKLADGIARQAFARLGNDLKRHYESADRLEKRGLYGWAEREYRYVIDAEQRSPKYALWCGNRLSLMLHDQGRDLEASQVLKGVIAQLDAVLAKRQLPAGLPAGARSQVQDSLRARMEYYLARHHAARKEWKKQRELLDRAIVHDPLDADVLIDMYRLPETDAAYRQRVAKLIAKAADAFRGAIKQDPTDSTPYNQLAWLVANTEGDVNEALEASRQSLRLAPGSAGYLDTLAHCYFAKGDLADAVRTQSEAVRLDPHTQAIARKLDVFRKAFDRAKGSPAPAKAEPAENGR